MRQAILEYLDDLEDYYLAVERLEQNLPGIPLEEETKWSAALGYRIEFDPQAGRGLTKLVRELTRRIVHFLRERVASLDDPRSIGEALHGPELGRFWK